MLVTAALGIQPINLRGQRGNWVIAASPGNSDAVYVAQDKSLLNFPTATTPDPAVGYAVLDSGGYFVLADFEGTLYALAASGTQLLAIMPIKNVSNLQTTFSITPGWVHSNIVLGPVAAATSLVLAAYGFKSLSMVVSWVGTPGAGLKYNVSVSNDGATWVLIDQPVVNNVLNGVDGLQYSDVTLATTTNAKVNPAGFLYVQITVPAAAAGVYAMIQWGLKH